MTKKSIVFVPLLDAAGATSSAISSALLEFRPDCDVVQLYSEGEHAGEVRFRSGLGASFLKQLGMEEVA